MKKSFSSKDIAIFGILFALVIVMQALGGSVSIGAVQLNFTLIPIVLGAVLFGAIGGAVLGFTCGVVVLIQVIMGMSPFYVIIWSYTPVITTLTCVVKTTVAGLVAGLIYKFIKPKNEYVAIFTASAIVPIINTALFIIGALCMGDAITAFQVQIGNTTGNALVFILVVLVTFNFFVELAVNLIVAPSLHRVLRVFDKNR